MDWFESPQYTKNIQKLMAMSPESKAYAQIIIDSLAPMYADEDMQKQLTAMRQATLDKERARSYEMGQNYIGLAQDQIDYEKSANKTAEAFGLANIGLSGLRGYLDMSNRRKLGRQMDEVTEYIKRRRR